MSCESNLTTKILMPRATASENNSMIAQYLSILLVVHPRQIPCNLINSPSGAKSAQVAEDEFCVLRQAPSVKPT